MEKINFSLENIEEISENIDSSFSIMKVDFFASGQNAHDLVISEETLLKTAKTIYNVPVVWKYDSKTKDAMSHEDDEYPCGFVKEGSLIEEKRLSDNRLMLSTVVYIWKKYSGKLIDIFKRDKKKSVSVEMTVLESNDDSGKIEVTDYKFEAITILGNFIRPAIPDASMSVLSFSKEYEDAYRKEFGYNKYSELDFRIPSDVKDNARMAIEKYEKSGRGGNSVSLSLAKFILKEEFITPEKIRMMYKKLSSYSKKSLDGDDDKIRFELWGGKFGYEWSKGLFEKIEAIDNKRSAFFVNKDNNADFLEKEGKEETPVKKKEFETKEEEKVETPEEEKSETPEEQKKEEEDKTEMASPESEDKEDMAVEEPKKEDMATEEEPKAEMSLDSYLDLAYTLSLMEEETESRKEFLKEEDEFALKCAVDEIKKEGEKDFAVVSKGMFAKMKEMSAKMAKMEAETKAYMSEFESLKSFKKSADEARFSYEVESTLKEVEAVMPSEEIEKARSESVNFSVDNIDAWKNAVKAKAFTFAKPSDKKNTKPELVSRWAFGVNVESKESLWKK